MTDRVTDPRSTATAGLAVEERADLLVVGAGPAGLAAAIFAAGHGRRVVLVDENPVPAAAMGDDIPLHYGQRMSGAARNVTAMTEALVAGEPLLAAAFEAGVDVRLGTAAWGLYGNGPSVGWLPGQVAGLSDGARSWMLGFGAAIVAAGRRDMGLAFPGWELPGVMGAPAAERLARAGALGAPLFARHVGARAAMFPGARHARVIRSWGGIIENTPDGRPVIDRLADPGNVVVATLSSIGFGLSPASGHAIQELVTDGACRCADLSTLRLSRFDGLAADWAAQRGWQAA